MVFGNLAKNMRNDNLARHYLQLSKIFKKYQQAWFGIQGKDRFEAKVSEEIRDTRFDIYAMGTVVMVSCYFVLPEEGADYLVGKVCFRNGEVRLLTLYFKIDGKVMSEDSALYGDILDEKRIFQTLDVLVNRLIETGVFPSDYEVN